MCLSLSLCASSHPFSRSAMSEGQALELRGIAFFELLGGRCDWRSHGCPSTVLKLTSSSKKQDSRLARWIVQPLSLQIGLKMPPFFSAQELSAGPQLSPRASRLRSNSWISLDLSHRRQSRMSKGCSSELYRLGPPFRTLHLLQNPTGPGLGP